MTLAEVVQFARDGKSPTGTLIKKTKDRGLKLRDFFTGAEKQSPDKTNSHDTDNLIKDNDSTNKKSFKSSDLGEKSHSKNSVSKNSKSSKNG
ncbi:hypothetical protein [Candidatus Sulfurimonas baltica]|uniref:Uncharacterized protein n=1 Tax=Candidatus Sulfurimonas baltica TaxID=2740404 RepID=A0A7S7LXF6_9BACT|nr:hypothetical protein [Candidatus Sulfurimonas baltica]QOY53206.1 hypothetical protein HUE88_05875 [Candidatus Sulfurimonas baltica]